MKKIISILMASTMLFSFTAPTFAADSSFSESCGHIENPTRFNPTDLSDYQKCWIDFYKADQASGMIGDLLWMRLGDDVISLTRGEIRAGGGESVIRSAVEDWVTQQMIMNLNDRIDAAEDRIAELSEDLTDAIDRAEAAEARVRFLEPIAAQVPGLQGDLMTARNNYAAEQREVMRLTGELQTMTSNYNTVNNTSHATEMDAFTAGQADVRANDPLYNNEDGINQQHVNDVDVDWSFDAANDLIELRLYDRINEADLFYQIPEATIISMLGINVEDGHGSTVSVANGIVTITGAGEATYVIEDGVHQTHVDAVVASSAQVSTDNRFLRVTLSNGNTADFNVSSVYQAGVDSVTAEDGHHSTVSVSTDGNTLTVTGANQAVHALLNGRQLATQAHVDALADITTARATLAGMGTGYDDPDFNVAMNRAFADSAEALRLVTLDRDALQTDLTSISGIAGQRGFTVGTVVQRVQNLANAYGAVTINARTRDGHVIDGEGMQSITVTLTNNQSATVSFTVSTPAGGQVTNLVNAINGISGTYDSAAVTATDFTARVAEIQGIVTEYQDLLTRGAANGTWDGTVADAGINYDTDLSDGGGAGYDNNRGTAQISVDTLQTNGNAGTTWSDPAYLLSLAIESSTFVGMHRGRPQAVTVDVGLGVMETYNIATLVNNFIDTVWEDGYDDGYSDGYDDGYEDGYADGFVDGTAYGRANP